MSATPKRMLTTDEFDMQCKSFTDLDNLDLKVSNQSLCLVRNILVWS